MKLSVENSGVKYINPIHICPACGVLCQGEEYCCCCREDQERWDRNAERANKLFSGQPRETGVMPEDPAARKQLVVDLARLGVNAVLLAVWLWMAVDLYQRCRH